MIATVMRLGLVMASLAAVGAAARVARLPMEPPLPLQYQRPAERTSGGRTAPADSAFRLAIQAAPFRLRRVPSSIRYDPAKLGGAAAAAVPKPPKPALVLSGIVWSETPAAVLEGIPGVEGARIVVKGDTVGGLRIRRIERSDVVVAGFDTTWVLTVKEVWR